MIKKGLKRNILFAVSALSLSVMLIGSWDISAHASEAVEEMALPEEGIEPRSPMIEWRYKVEDGVLYRRLYNYRDQCWVGEWEVCPW